MKVLNTPDEQQETVKMTCDVCQADLEIEREDCKIGWNGWCCCECPCCGNALYPEIWDVKLNEKNIEYPLHFTDPNGQVAIADDSIQKAIRRGIEIMKKDASNQSYFIDSGDTLVTMFRLEDEDSEEILVFVSKNPQDCTIPL